MHTGVEELIQVSYNTSATQNTSISANPNMMFKADQQSSISTSELHIYNEVINH